MKRFLTIAVLALLIVGGGGVAYAHSTGDHPIRRAAARACIQDARAANEGPDRATIRAAAKICMEERRAELRSCIEAARAEHGDDRPAVRDAVRECTRA